jgi:predicted transcriptional regulator
MLAALMGGQSLTATELAYAANISRSTASGHLTRLAAAGLLTVTRQRRFAYYRIASPLVAHMLESIKQVAAIETPPRHRPRSARDDALRFARTCYDHLAGTVGVALTDALVERGHVVLSDDGGEVTPSGDRFLRGFGVNLDPPAGSRRLFCQPCLDWSERRWHLKGVVGAGLLCRCLELGWFRRERDSRALRLTPAGRLGLVQSFGVEFEDPARPRGAAADRLPLRA